MMLKLTCKQKLNSISGIIIENMLFQLEKADYNIYEKTDQVIRFNNSNLLLKFVDRSKLYRKANKGLFQIDILNDKLELTFYVSVIREAISMSVLIFMIIYTEPFAAIIAFAIIVQFAFKIIDLRETAKEMLTCANRSSEVDVL